jgi:hypothetical protein
MDTQVKKERGSQHGHRQRERLSDAAVFVFFFWFCVTAAILAVFFFLTAAARRQLTRLEGEIRWLL